jgi:hypothetical protein
VENSGGSAGETEQDSRLGLIDKNKNRTLAGCTASKTMSPNPQPSPDEDNDVEAAVDEAIAACDGDLRATIRALIVANKFLECEVAELMKSVSHAYTRGRFHTYSG